jgi:nitric oxide reductase large subunit
MSMRNLRMTLGVVVRGIFSIVGIFGIEVYRQAPPIPERMA